MSPSLLQDTYHNHIISPLNCSWRWSEHYRSFINLSPLESALLSTGETNVHDRERQDLRCTVTQQKITTSHNPEKDIYCLVQGRKTPECPSAASVTLRKQKARRKKVLLTQLRAERGRKFRGIGARRKLWEKKSRDMFQEEVKIPLPPIRKVPLNLTYSSCLSLLPFIRWSPSYLCTLQALGSRGRTEEYGSLHLLC